MAVSSKCEQCHVYSHRRRLNTDLSSMLCDVEETSSAVTVEPCPDDLFTCDDGGCALQAWTCDGDNDCDDGSDEVGCRTHTACLLITPTPSPR